jgi:alkyl sulfatase BDS1-like metallo-beta-lactamase superfamily hydrolase
MTVTSNSIFPGTIAFNRQVATRLSLSDRKDVDDAQRGWITSLSDPVTRNDGGTAWDNRWFDFLNADCPDCVNPSLWRHAQLNAINGLFEVVKNVWQIRCVDYANMTIIRGETGWILVDPLMTRETAEAALALVNSELGQRPVSAVLITHTHTSRPFRWSTRCGRSQHTDLCTRWLYGFRRL